MSDYTEREVKYRESNKLLREQNKRLYDALQDLHSVSDRISGDPWPCTTDDMRSEPERLRAAANMIEMRERIVREARKVLAETPEHARRG